MKTIKFYTWYKVIWTDIYGNKDYRCFMLINI